MCRIIGRKVGRMVGKEGKGVKDKRKAGKVCRINGRKDERKERRKERMNEEMKEGRKERHAG